MFVIVAGVAGVILFLVATLALGVRLRYSSDKDVACKVSRLGHVCFYLLIVAPALVGLFYPGYTHYDALLGLPSLPFHTAAFGVGLLVALPALLLLAMSNRTLARLGAGTAAFLLTKQLVDRRLYQRTRNPMSLGFYLACIAAGLLSGSTGVTLGSVLAVIPAHLFYLKYLEERELEIRFGRSYLEYKRDVPFLIPRFKSVTR